MCVYNKIKPHLIQGCSFGHGGGWGHIPPQIPSATPGAPTKIVLNVAQLNKKSLKIGPFTKKQPPPPPHWENPSYATNSMS